jgi:hypothetical protein
VAAALFTLIDGERQIDKAGVGTTLVTTPCSDALCDYVLGSDDVLLVPDARQDARWLCQRRIFLIGSKRGRSAGLVALILALSQAILIVCPEE